jgi:hypothetical protein
MHRLGPVLPFSSVSGKFRVNVAMESHEDALLPLPIPFSLSVRRTAAPFRDRSFYVHRRKFANGSKARGRVPMRDTGPRFADERASTFRLFRARDLARVVASRDSWNVAWIRHDGSEREREESEGRERFRANRSTRRLPAETGSRNGRCGTRVRAIQLSGRSPRADRGRGYHKSRLTVGKIFAAQPVVSFDFSTPNIRVPFGYIASRRYARAPPGKQGRKGEGRRGGEESGAKESYRDQRRGVNGLNVFAIMR